MRGFVPTPREVVDRMVAELFADKPPQPSHHLLDPGCGTGAFIEGVVRWCRRNGAPTPSIEGIEIDPALLSEARKHLGTAERITLRQLDYLDADLSYYDYVIANPPYVSISKLTEDEKAKYRKEYTSATGRFDLYFLFLERSLQQLKPGGRLVYITPEKYLYVESARSLRKLLASNYVRRVELLAEGAFPGLTTYPAITVIEPQGPAAGQATAFRGRGGAEKSIRFTASGDSLLPAMNGERETVSGGPTLDDVCSRISAGVATGADAVFVKPAASLEPSLKRFAYPTVSGRQLLVREAKVQTVDSMLVPYDRAGRLKPFEALDAFGEYLVTPNVKSRLMERTCVRRKPWYAFHETPPLTDILQPKILCKDISYRPRFWLDENGSVVPRHTVYYMIPLRSINICQLLEYLNSAGVREWLARNCQRAANGFLRLQSSSLKRLPVPPELAARLDEVQPRLLLDAGTDDYERLYASLVGVP